MNEYVSYFLNNTSDWFWLPINSILFRHFCSFCDLCKSPN